MNSANKGLAVFIILIITVSILSILMVQPAFATQIITKTEIPKPTIPQFSLALYDSSYDVPAFSTTNPYNGQQTTQPFSHYEERTLVFTIQNQVLTTFRDNSYNVNIYYNIRYKGHFDQNQNWIELFGPNFGYVNPTSGPQTIYIANGTYNSEFDIRQFSVGFPADGQIDFQVEALIGYPTTPTIFTGQESGWAIHKQ